MEFPEYGIAEDVNTLDTKQRVIEAYVEIALTATKPADRIRALDKIAELRGFKIDRMVSNLKTCSPEELENIIEDLCIPMLGPFEVRGKRLPRVDDVPLDD